MDTASRTTIEDRFTVALMAFVIFGLGALSAARWTICPKTISVEEKRHLEAFPHLRMTWESALAFPSKFEAFTNDRFAFRTPLISALSKAKYRLLAFSQSADVLVGKNGWLFYLGQGEGCVLRHSHPFSTSDAEAWALHFEARRAWLALHNVKYLVYISPGKGDIYPEFLPDEYVALNSPARQDQFLQALKRLTRVRCLDLRTVLLSAKTKSKWPLYYKTDTHWNSLGAFVAYSKVAEYLSRTFSAIVPTKLDEMWFSECQHGNGDLACLMGLNGQIPENVVRIHHKQLKRWKFASEPKLAPELAKLQFGPPLATEVNDPKLPRAIFIRDSFMDAQQPFFSEHFTRACYCWSTAFPVALIEAEKPDVVVEEFVERNLFSTLSPNPSAIDETKSVAESGASAQVGSLGRTIVR